MRLLKLTAFLYLGVDSAVGDQLDAPVGEQQVDQDPGVVLRVPHSQAPEPGDRAPARPDAVHEVCERKSGLHGKAQLP